MERVATLSPQEKRVLIALSYGNLYKEIADDYNISINTVKKHLKNAYRKLQVGKRRDAVEAFILGQRQLDAQEAGIRI